MELAQGPFRNEGKRFDPSKEGSRAVHGRGKYTSRQPNGAFNDMATAVLREKAMARPGATAQWETGADCRFHLKH